MMALTYFRTYAQALPVVEAVAKKTYEVAKEVIKVGEVVLRDLTAEDFGVSDWKVSVPAGNTGVIDAYGSASSPLQVPDRKAIGLYGIVLETEPDQVHVDFVDLFVGGSRVRRWVLHPVKDGADTGRTLYFNIDQTIILKEGTKYYVQVRAINEDTANAHDIRLVFLGFIAEPLNETLTRIKP